MIKQFAIALRLEFFGYNGKKFGQDVMAGITVAAVALPLALAFGVSSGADAAAGLITAILAGIVIGSLSGASFQISGPTGAMAAILASVVAKHGIQGIFLASLLAGVILLLAGLLRLGRVVSIIPAPVITGFTSGIAVIIALGQVNNLFGVTSSGNNEIEKLFSYTQLGFSPNWSAVLFGAIVILLMVFWPKKWGAAIPSSLASLIFVLILNHFLKLNVPVVGEIPKTLLPAVRLSFGAISLSSLPSMVTPALSIAALGMIESLLCGASAGQMKGERLDADRELVAQGVGNILIPFFGGVPATAAIARTSVAIKAGAQTRLTSIIHSVVLVLSMFLLGGIMSQIPMSALAGVLMMTAWRMNEWTGIRYIMGSGSRWMKLSFLLTMIATVVFDLSVAIVAGLAFCAILFVAKSTEIEVCVTAVDGEKLNIPADCCGHIKVVYITGSVFFGTINSIIDALECIDREDFIVISMRGVPHMDPNSAHALARFCRRRRTAGSTVVFSGVQNAVRPSMEDGGILAEVGEDGLFWSADQAILSLCKNQ